MLSVAEKLRCISLKFELERVDIVDYFCLNSFVHAVNAQVQEKAILMEEFHYKLLKVLQDNPDLSQRELAREVGLSLGKTNYCLRALIEKGFIKASNFRNNQNKVAYAYLLTPRGIEEKVQATAYFLKRKVAEYEALEKEIEQLRDEVKAGRPSAKSAA